MIHIKVNEKTLTVPIGTKPLELLPKDDIKKYVVCKISGQIKELTYKLSEKNEGANITFYGLEIIRGGKAYEATIRYVIAMAFYNLYPDIKIRFSYYVSRSIFCEIITPNVSLSNIYKNIEQEIKRIIKADLPITRVTLSKEEAKNIYISQKMVDKLDILEYRPEDNVHLYKCGDYYNYLHSYMARFYWIFS